MSEHRGTSASDSLKPWSVLVGGVVIAGVAAVTWSDVSVTGVVFLTLVLGLPFFVAAAHVESVGDASWRQIGFVFVLTSAYTLAAAWLGDKTVGASFVVWLILVPVVVLINWRVLRGGSVSRGRRLGEAGARRTGR